MVYIALHVFLIKEVKNSSNRTLVYYLIEKNEQKILLWFIVTAIVGLTFRLLFRIILRPELTSCHFACLVSFFQFMFNPFLPGTP